MFFDGVSFIRALAALVACVFSFTVSAAPLLVSDVANIELPAGSPPNTPATFQVAATGQGQVTYQWFRLEQYFAKNKPSGNARVKLTGQTTPELTVTNWGGVKGTSLGSYTIYSYYVEVSDGTGTIESSTRRVSVMVSLPPSAPNLFQDLLPLYAVKEGETLSLSAGVTANPLIVFWFHEGILQSDLTNTFFALSPAALTNQGTWWLVASNSLGSVTSRVAQVQVTPTVLIPEIEFVSSQLGSVTIDLDHLVVTNGFAPTLADLQGHSLVLDITGGQAPFITNGTWTLNLAANGTYTVTSAVMPASSGQWSLPPASPFVTEIELTTFYTDMASANLYILDSRYFELTKPGVVANQHGNSSLTGYNPTLTTNLAKAQFSLVASTTSGLTLSYQWFKDGVIIQGSTNTVISFDPATPGNTGIYTCVVTRSDGKTRTSPPGVLTVIGAGTRGVSFAFPQGMLALSWPAGARLETKASIQTVEWTTLDLTSPALLSPTNASALFRWVLP